MTQMLDINGILVTQLGDRIPCKLVDVNDKGYLVIYALDPVEINSRLQLMTNSPRINSVIKVTSSDNSGDSYILEALPEEPIENIRAKIVEGKIKDIIDH